MTPPWRSAALLSLVLVLSTLGSLAGHTAAAGRTDAGPLAPFTLLTPRPPIVIEGNADFTAANGVTSGNGTPTDPYVIAGWNITGPESSPGIWIRNTTASFVLRDSWVNGSLTGTSEDIELVNVVNGELVNLTLRGNAYGMLLLGVAHVTVTDTNVTAASGSGFYVYGGTNVSLLRNTILMPTLPAIELVWLSDSFVADNDLAGAMIYGSWNLSLENNTVHPSMSSFIVRDSHDIRLTGNDFTDDGALLAILDSDRLTLHRNRFSTYGISLFGASFEAYASHTISLDNSVAGKPLRYYSGCSGVSIDGLDTGQLLVANCSGVDIANLTITTGWLGIEVAYSSGVNIESVTMSSLGFWGIRLTDVSWVNLSNVQVANALYSAISAERATDLSVRDFVSTSSGYGTIVTGGRDLRMKNASISGAYVGIIVQGVEGFTIEGSSISSSTYGIQIESSDAGWIGNNSMERLPGYSVAGLADVGSTNVVVVGNTVAGYALGVNLTASRGWRLYQNRFVYNVVSAVDRKPGLNEWDAGYPTGGNYWTDYMGWDDCRGPAQDDCTAGDGFGDTPYVISAASEDRYPIVLVNPPNRLPVAVIGALPSLAHPGEAISFDASESRDIDGVIVSYAWAFGDGGAASTVSPVHAYAKAGNYTVNLTVTDNRRGSNATSAVVRVEQATPPSVALVMWASANGYQLLVPRDWTRHEDWVTGGSTYDLYQNGSYNGADASLLIDSSPDPSAREDSGYLGSLVSAMLGKAHVSNPDASLVASPTFTTLSGHAAATFVLRRNDSVVQQVAIVVSAAHQQAWTITLTVSSSQQANLSGTFDQIAASFLITAPPPAPAVPMLVLAAGGVAAVAVVLAAVILLRRRRLRRPPAGPPPEIPAPPDPKH